MNKLKVSLLVLILLILSPNLAYSDNWIEGSHSFTLEYVDFGYWAGLDEGKLANIGVKKSDIVGIRKKSGHVWINDLQKIIFHVPYIPEPHVENFLDYVPLEREWKNVFYISDNLNEEINYKRTFQYTSPYITYIPESDWYSGFTEGIWYEDYYVITKSDDEIPISQVAEWVPEYLKPSSGNITIEKYPTYIFTKWHKNDNDTPCGMDLKISWESSNELDEFKGIKYMYVKMVVVRYQEMGEDIYDIYEGPVDSSGLMKSPFDFDRFEYEHAGNEESALYILALTDELSVISLKAPIPINGYFGINISEVPDNAIRVDKIFLKSVKDVESFSF